MAVLLVLTDTPLHWLYLLCTSQMEMFIDLPLATIL